MISRRRQYPAAFIDNLSRASHIRGYHRQAGVKSFDKTDAERLSFKVRLAENIGCSQKPPDVIPLAHKANAIQDLQMPRLFLQKVQVFPLLRTLGPANNPRHPGRICP